MSYRTKAENILTKLRNRIGHSSIQSLYGDIIEVENVNFIYLRLYNELPNGQTINYETQTIYIPIYDLPMNGQRKNVIEDIMRLLICKDQFIRNDRLEFPNTISYHNDKFTIYLYSLLILHELNTIRDFPLKKILSLINGDCLRFAVNFDNLVQDDYIKFLKNLTKENYELFFKHLKDNIVLEILEGKE